MYAQNEVYTSLQLNTLNTCIHQRTQTHKYIFTPTYKHGEQAHVLILHHSSLFFSQVDVAHGLFDQLLWPSGWHWKWGSCSVVQCLEIIQEDFHVPCPKVCGCTPDMSWTLQCRCRQDPHLSNVHTDLLIQALQLNMRSMQGNVEGSEAADDSVISQNMS